MIKIPSISSKNILEVKRKFDMGVTYAKLKRDYNISYNDIKKILRYFADCQFESDVDGVINGIDEKNRRARVDAYKANYQKNKDYFQNYARSKYAQQIAV